MINNSNGIFFEKPFNISNNLEKLVNEFNFYVDPKDGIKNVKIKYITLVSPCESYDLSFVINDNKESLLNAIKSKNLSTRCLAVKEICLDISFHKKLFDDKNKKISVRINYFHKTKPAFKNTIIKKYLKNWGLLNAESKK